MSQLNQTFTENLRIPGDLCIKWHGIGGRTIAKVLQYHLKIVQSFAPDIVVLQLGTNDLQTISAIETGSALEDLTRLLYESYGVWLVCVCQTIFCRDAPLFNNQVKILFKYHKATSRLLEL